MIVNGRFLTEDATGVGRFALELTKALVELDPDIQVAVPTGTRTHSDLDANLVDVGSHRGHVWEQIELPRWLRRRPGSPVLVNLANRAPVTVPCQLVILHDIIPVRFPGDYSIGYSTAFKVIPRILAHRATIATVSEFSRAEVSAWLGIDPKNVPVIPNAADHLSAPEALVRAAPDAGRPFFLSFGRSDSRRQTSWLVEAWDRLDIGRSADLLLVGDMSERDRELAAAAPSVRSTGRISDARLRELYEAASAFIAPSVYEGFDIPTIEAQRFGCPVVASDIPVHKEVLRATADYFAPGDVDALGRALSRSTENSARRSRDGLLNSQRFTWMGSARTLIEAVAARHPDEK